MRERWKDALMTVFIGALIAFITSFVEGLSDLLSGYANNAAGAAAGSALYGYKHLAAKLISLYHWS